jgi:S1-C subfamily serine protease
MPVRVTLVAAFSGGVSWGGTMMGKTWLAALGVLLAPISSAPAQVASAPPQHFAFGSSIAIAARHLLTAAHVVERCTRILVYPMMKTEDGEKREAFPARIVTIDRTNDLALLRIMGHEFREWVKLSTKPVQLYQPVFAYGYPVGKNYGIGTYSEGEVLATMGLAGNTQLFQLSAPVDHGASGGAVVDVAGNLVGVIHARVGESIMMKSLREVSAHLTFAIKSSVVDTFLEAHGISATMAKNGPELSIAGFISHIQYITKPVRCEVARGRNG